ncbi:BURP domain-containing protein [Tanacetum coccineum]
MARIRTRELQPLEIHVPDMLACHTMAYPYTVYYCHAQKRVGGLKNGRPPCQARQCGHFLPVITSCGFPSPLDCVMGCPGFPASDPVASSTKYSYPVLNFRLYELVSLITGDSKKFPSLFEVLNHSSCLFAPSDLGH